MRIPAEILIPEFQDNLYGAAYSVLQNAADAQDAVQMTFIRYHLSDLQFEDREHIRSWLFRVVLNQAKDIRRSFWRRNRTSLDQLENTFVFEDRKEQDLFEEVSRLPARYRVVLQLYYFEDYKVKEIAQILEISESNVKKRLSRARDRLKEVLKEDWDNENEQFEQGKV